MTPTAKLRWLEMRSDASEAIFYDLHPSASRGLHGKVRVLQQWWQQTLGEMDSPEVKGEWRDIPVEEA